MTEFAEDLVHAHRFTNAYPGLITYLRTKAGRELDSVGIWRIVQEAMLTLVAYGSLPLDEGSRIPFRQPLDWPVLLRMMRAKYAEKASNWVAEVDGVCTRANADVTRAMRSVEKAALASKISSKLSEAARKDIWHAHDALRRATQLLDALELPQTRESNYIEVAHEPA